MSLSCHAGDSRIGGGPRKPGRLAAADWLSLAAAPTFAAMALLSVILGGGSPDTICSTDPQAALLTGMVPMYVLMSAFHAAPWLRVLRGPASAGARATPPVLSA